MAIAMGVGLYYGGLKLNLDRFFRVTGGFLVLIAAGLALDVLRTSHEAGWLNIGQQQVLDLSSWIPENSVQGALISGPVPHTHRSPAHRSDRLAALRRIDARGIRMAGPGRARRHAPGARLLRRQSQRRRTYQSRSTPNSESAMRGIIVTPAPTGVT